MIIRNRTGGTILYIVLILFCGFAGVATRKFPGIFPSFFAAYAGDTLWAMALYFLVSIFLYKQSMLFRVPVAAILSLAVELSQQYQTPWLESVRNTLAGRLILGHGFLWSDLLCYAAGIGIAVVLESLFIRKV